MTNVSRQLSEHVAAVRFEGLGGAGVAAAKRATLDTIGAMLAGSAAEGVHTVVGLATAWGGVGEAKVIGEDRRLPAPLAAWCNGVMARALEIDDCVDFLPIHPSASAVPALLALAEARGGLSGRDFITALAVGQDLIIRLGLATRVNAVQSGRYNLFQIFGLTAAAARALGFGADQTQNALGIAYAFANGEGQSALDGALSLRLQQGNVAQAALVSALLAERGFTGSKDFLLGRMGFFRAFEPDPNLEPLTKDLGTYFWGEQLSIKPFSACRCCHPAIGLALGYRAEVAGRVDTVRKVRVRVCPGVHSLVGAQLDDAPDPQSSTAAQFSLPYTVAAALVRGDFFLEQLRPDDIGDPTIRGLARRVEVISDPGLNTDFVLGRTVLEIEADGHGLVTLEQEKPLGNPANPLTLEACTSKVRKCAAAASRPPKVADLEAVIDAVLHIEDVPDVSVVSARL